MIIQGGEERRRFSQIIVKFNLCMELQDSPGTSKLIVYNSSMGTLVTYCAPIRLESSGISEPAVCAGTVQLPVIEGMFHFF